MVLWGIMCRTISWPGRIDFLWSSGCSFIFNLTLIYNEEVVLMQNMMYF